MKRIMNYTMKKAKDVPDSLAFKRVGIIPYFINDNVRHYFMMVDTKHEDLTDCGGLPRKKEKWIDTAIRETREESRNFFRFTKKYILNNGYVIWREDNRIAIIFVNVSKWMDSKNDAINFCNRYKLDYDKGVIDNDKTSRLENCEMNIFEEEDLHLLCKEKDDNRIYIPVRRLIQKLFVRKYYTEMI